MILEFQQTEEGLFLTFNGQEFLIPDAYASDMEITIEDEQINNIELVTYSELH